MSRTWKWILGIVVVLVVLAVIGGAGFLAMRGYGFAAMRAFQTAPAAGNNTTPRAWRMPMHDYEGGPMMPYHQRAFGPGYFPRMGFGPGSGMMPFGMGFFWLGGIFRLVIPLGLVALIVFLGYQWGKRAGARTAQPAPVAGPAAPPPPAPATGAAPPAPSGEAGPNEGGEPPA